MNGIKQQQTTSIYEAYDTNIDLLLLIYLSWNSFIWAVTLHNGSWLPCFYVEWRPRNKNR